MIAPDLSNDRRAALSKVAEGWIGALRASVTGTGGSPDIDPAAWLLGPGLDLLFGRWVAALDPVDRDLLVRCSVLDTLTPEACDWIVGRSDSAVRLAGLSEAQVVAPPVGALGFQYRAHGLLQEYLRRRLSARGRQAMAQAHGAAGLWLASQGDVDSAVTQLLNAGQIDKAREVLGAHVAGAVGLGSFGPGAWLVSPGPPACATRGPGDAARGGVVGGPRWGTFRPPGHIWPSWRRSPPLPLPRPAPGDSDAASGLAWLRTETLFLRAYLEAWAGRTARARELVGKVRATYGTDWNRTSPQAAALMGVRLDLWHGDDEAARAELLTLSSRPRPTSTTAQWPSLRWVRCWPLTTGERIGRGSWPTRPWLPSRRPGRSVRWTTATPSWPEPRALVDLGNPVAALQDAVEVERRGASVGHIGYLVLGAVARARALAAGGDWPAAQQALEEASRRGRRKQAVGNALAQVVDSAVVEVAVESSDRDRANRALERIPVGRAQGAPGDPGGGDGGLPDGG